MTSGMAVKLSTAGIVLKATEPVPQLQLALGEY